MASSVFQEFLWVVQLIGAAVDRLERGDVSARHRRRTIKVRGRHPAGFLFPRDPRTRLLEGFGIIVASSARWSLLL